MFEGKRVKFTHLVDEDGEWQWARVVGCDKKKGIVVISEEDPDEILLCMTPELPLYDKFFRLVSSAIKKEKVNFREMFIKEHGKQAYRRVKMYALLKGVPVGAPQEELHKRCPFKA